MEASGVVDDGDFMHNQKPTDVSKELLLRMSDDLYADFQVTYSRDRLSYTTDEELACMIVGQLKYVLAR